MWDYPKSRVDAVSEQIHGRTIVDNYRWLEDAESPEVNGWVHRQNTLTEAVLTRRPEFKRVTIELEEDFDSTIFSSPVRVAGKYFWHERRPGQDQFVIYVSDSLEGEERVLVDANGLGGGNTVALDGWTESPQGTYLAYGLFKDGDEIPTISIKNVATGDDLIEQFVNAPVSSLRWLPDESGFYYVRAPKPGSVAKNELRYHAKVYLHLLGDDQEDDVMIFGKDRPKDDMLSLSLTPCGRYLGVRVAQGWNRSELFLFDQQSQQTVALTAGQDALFSMTSTKECFLVRTNLGAPNYRILSAPIGDIGKQIEDWSELIPESGSILSMFAVTADRILVNYMVDVSDQVKMFDHQGKFLADLPMPAFSRLGGFSSNRDEAEFFFSCISFFIPKQTQRFDPQTGNFSLYRSSKVVIDPADYIVKQEWAESRDGTKVPMFILHHKEVTRDGHNPTVMYGYGCHGISQHPGFMRTYLPWLRHKGVFVQTNIRGGGEYGEQWHRDGSLEKKQNTFDDFIACAEYLIAARYTNTRQLGIVGGSNGGLMVAAVMTQRPELFKAVVCQAPVLDLYRFQKFLIASRWVKEFGNPDIAAQFSWLENWSPYHHVRQGVSYPAILLTTGMNDTRVHPLHAWKMAALLQASTKDSPILLRTDLAAGHGPGKPLSQRLSGQAQVLTLFAWQLGLEI